MTLEEKCTLIHGVKGEGEYEDGFHIQPIPRLGIPAIRMAEGPGNANAKNMVWMPGAISINPLNWKLDDSRGVVVTNADCPFNPYTNIFGDASFHKRTTAFSTTTSRTT